MVEGRMKHGEQDMPSLRKKGTGGGGLQWREAKPCPARSMQVVDHSVVETMGSDVSADLDVTKGASGGGEERDNEGWKCGMRVGGVRGCTRWGGDSGVREVARMGEKEF
jgi:hypothetical protein